MSQSEIHISDVRSFRQCRRKWEWSSRLRKNLERTVPYAPFFTGKAIHAALEFFYTNQKTFEDTLAEYLRKEWQNVESLGMLWPAEKTQLEEQVELIYGILGHYRLWVAQDERNYADKYLQIVDMEVPWELPLPSVDATCAGRFDGIAKHSKTGELWVLETKTARSVSSLLSTLSLDEQCTLYVWAAQQMYPNENVGGVLYNILRKKEPAQPGILQDGTLSKSTRIDTTAFHYLQCAREEHPDWPIDTIQEVYGGTLEALQENESKFFMRFPVRRTAVEVSETMNNIQATAREMLNPDISIYPAPGWATCQFCTFKSPCLAMSQGTDPTVLLEAEFQPRASHESMRPDDEEDEEDG